MPSIEQSARPTKRAGTTPGAAAQGRARQPRQPRPASGRQARPAPRQARTPSQREARAAAPQRAERSGRSSFEKFVRTPKGYVLGVLLVLLAITLPNQGMLAWQATIASALAAILMDLALRRSLALSTSALLTGLFVAMVMDPHTALAAIVATSGGAIAIKHLVRTRKSHIFNPASVALALAPPLLGAGESWWGATAGLPAVALLPLLIGGYVVVDRVNKLPSVLTFLGVYFTLFTAAAALVPGETTHLAQFYRDPFIGAVLFFACFMLTDPPTSPVRLREQLIFGVGVAALAVGVELTRDTLSYLFVGLLVGNAWWSWRRVIATRPLPANTTSAVGATAPARQETFLEKRLPGLRPVPGSRRVGDA